MATVVLVHGAWHDSWCWNLLSDELHRRGHQVVAPDLPSDDPEQSFADYADVVADAVLVDGPVIVVGHSLAGHTIPLVPRPDVRVGHLVYLCALVPVPGMSFAEQLGSSPGMLDLSYAAGLGETDDSGRRAWVDLNLARHHLYADCDPDLVAEAGEHLRPQAQTPYLSPCLLEAYPDVPTTYIVCSEDALVRPQWSRAVATERLNASVIEIEGSHSPFLSRPAELADILHGLATKPRV